jgi:hypothetical protein
MNINFKADPWLLAGLPALIYLLVRAALLDFTYDECWSYLGYAQAPFWDVLVNTHPAANNHVLHSLLMKGSAFLFGNAPFALRVPVLLGFILYALAIHRLLVGVGSLWRTVFTIALLYQPYVLDYFVAARGYGIALPALMWAIVCLTRFAEVRRIRWLWWGGLVCLLMAWANFTYLLLVVVWWSMALVIGWRQGQLKGVLPAVLGFTALSVVLFVPAIWKLIEAKELYYGAASIEETFRSLGARFLYDLGEHSWQGTIMAILLGLSPLAWKSWSKASLRFTAVAAVMIFGALLLNGVQHWIIGSPYFIDRTGIFLIPLAILALIGVVHWIPARLNWPLAVFLIALFSMNFIRAVNFSYLIDFKEYADVAKAMRWVKDHTDGPSASMEIGKSTYLNAPINYYKERLQLEHIKHSGLAYCDAQDEYPIYYLFEKDLGCVDGMDVDTIARYPVSRTYLLRPKEEGPTLR